MTIAPPPSCAWAARDLGGEELVLEVERHRTVPPPSLTSSAACRWSLAALLTSGYRPMRWRISSIAVSGAAMSVTCTEERARKVGGADLGDEVLDASTAMSIKPHWPSARRSLDHRGADARPAAGTKTTLSMRRVAGERQRSAALSFKLKGETILKALIAAAELALSLSRARPHDDCNPGVIGKSTHKRSKRQ